MDQYIGKLGIVPLLGSLYELINNLISRAVWARKPASQIADSFKMVEVVSRHSYSRVFVP